MYLVPTKLVGEEAVSKRQKNIPNIDQMMMQFKSLLFSTRRFNTFNFKHNGALIAVYINHPSAKGSNFNIKTVLSVYATALV